MSSNEQDPSGPERIEKASLGEVLEREYSNHQDQLLISRPTTQRIAELESSLIQAFKGAIEYREVPFIRFGDLDAQELANAFVSYAFTLTPYLSRNEPPMKSLSIGTVNGG